MNRQIPQPDEKIQPIRLISQREAHQREASAAGVEDLVEFRAFYCRDVLLYGAVAGPEDGEPVILLHGFPDFWVGWAPLIRPLVQEGYRVILPDQRGYNFSEKPPNVEDYRLQELGTDVIDLLDIHDFEAAHVVGHDWGGAVTWWLAENVPQRFRSVVILNCPHYAVLAEAIKFRHLRQMVRSWYIGFFQIPILSERILSAGRYRLLESALHKMSVADAFSPAEIEVYRRAWDRPDAVRSMLNWYRAGRSFAFGDTAFAESNIDIHVEIIWGKKDAALDASLVEPSAQRCRSAHIHWVPAAGHWVQRDASQEVAEKLLEILQGQR